MKTTEAILSWKRAACTDRSVLYAFSAFFLGQLSYPILQNHDTSFSPMRDIQGKFKVLFMKTGMFQTNSFNSFNTLRFLCSLLLSLFCASISARAATNLTSALQQALFEEEANHNLAAAIQSYQSLIARFDQDRKLAATAIFRLGECYRKQGNTNDASTQYQRVVREFSDQSTLLDLSRQNLAAPGIAAPSPASSATATRFWRLRSRSVD